MTTRHDLPRNYLAGRPDRPDLVAKALKSQADALFLDFEDAVPPDNRPAGRTHLVEVLGDWDHSKPILVRCNRLDGPDGAADLDACVRAGVVEVTFPKMEGADDVRAAVDALRSAEQAHGLAAGSLKLWLMIETGKGAVELPAMLTACDEVAGVFVGPGDMSLDLGLPVIGEDRVTFDHTMIHAIEQQVCLVARAHGVAQVMTAAYERNHALDEVREAALRIFSLGFTALEIQTPRHVPVVNEAWRPSPARSAHARAIVEAFEGQGMRDGVVEVNDQGIQQPMYLASLDLLAREART